MGKTMFGSDSLEGIVNTEELKKKYGSWETKDLLKAVTIDKADYEPRAIEIINEELQRRGINDKSKTEFKKDWQESSFRSIGTLQCPKCHSFNVTDRGIWNQVFWGYFFGLLSALLIPRYRCLECGWKGSKNDMDRDR